jgi:hypothetical protein
MRSRNSRYRPRPNAGVSENRAFHYTGPPFTSATLAPWVKIFEKNVPKRGLPRMQNTIDASWRAIV